MSMWDLLEGHKNPAPLLWSWFGAVKMERKALTYEENHRLLKFHTHSLVKPSSYFYEPLPLPPEDAEEPMLDKNRDDKADTPSSVESPSGMGSAKKKGPKRPRKPKSAITPTQNATLQNQVTNPAMMMQQQPQHPQQMMGQQPINQQFNNTQQGNMNNMNMMQNNMGMMQNNMMMNQVNMGMGQNINQNQMQMNQQMNMNQMQQTNPNMTQMNQMQYQQQQQQMNMSQMNINQQNMGQMNMNMNQMGQQNQQWNYNNMQQQQPQGGQGNQQFYNQGMTGNMGGAPQSKSLIIKITGNLLFSFSFSESICGATATLSIQTSHFEHDTNASAPTQPECLI